MGIDLTIKIGGEAGQGIQTIGSLLCEICHSAGLYIISVDDFESRIRGGHSFNLLRIGNEPILAPGHRIDLLVALDQRTYELNKNQMTDQGIVILNDDTKNESLENCLFIPLMELAKNAGNRITANTVAAGAVLSILGTPFHRIEQFLVEGFKNKGDKVVELNIRAAKSGYMAAEAIKGFDLFNWEKKSNDTVLMNGAKAAALGALAADCRFFTFYPMSPATGIFTNVIPYSESLPVIIEQAEDEIAAVNMAIGASFAGVRALTATSGGGFSLMTEGLGLAAMTETPLVVINAHRPGPSTGLATRTAKADLLFVINASQDDFPRFVFAPGTPLETFRLTQKAFALADHYQVPVIILIDQFLADSTLTQDNRFSIMDDAQETFILDQDKISSPGAYKRYAVTPDGISPRALPCQGKALVRATGNEHDEKGSISEDPENRIRMMEKRHAKLAAMKQEMSLPEIINPDSRTFLTGWGSTRGILIEACQKLNSLGIDIGCMLFRDLWPLDSAKLRSILDGHRLIMVEQNYSSQLGKLIAQETGILYHEAILSYNGRPLYSDLIIEKIIQLTEKSSW